MAWCCYTKRCIQAGADVAVRALVGKDFVVVILIHEEGIAPLLDVVQATYGFGLFFRLGERRQQHGRENGDDGDDHQQFNEREGGRDFFREQVHFLG